MVRVASADNQLHVYCSPSGHNGGEAGHRMLDQAVEHLRLITHYHYTHSKSRGQCLAGQVWQGGVRVDVGMCQYMPALVDVCSSHKVQICVLIGILQIHVCYKHVQVCVSQNVLTNICMPISTYEYIRL